MAVKTKPENIGMSSLGPIQELSVLDHKYYVQQYTELIEMLKYL